LYDLTSFDKRSDELVIGLRPDTDEELKNLIDKSDAKLVNTILMNGKISAIVAEIPSEGNTNILVAVVDTGIDYNHPDLVANCAH